ncbi:MAG: preprotein translocase subunit YajC [Candidatus Hydrogenedentes bacterium]|nr:preprotein translocase subunit YajC [Candidatus Hydrogenedentota bacterium]
MKSLWIFFIAFMAIMYFLMIRPNQKREKERRDMLSSLAKGDKVVTTGGICGTIVGLTDKSVVIKVSDEPIVKIEFLRAAVSRVAARDEKSE